jgi:hypothetical protein
MQSSPFGRRRDDDEEERRGGEGNVSLSKVPNRLRSFMMSKCSDPNRSI